jgi:hypothetical protein
MDVLVSLFAFSPYFRGCCCNCVSGCKAVEDQAFPQGFKFLFVKGEPSLDADIAEEVQQLRGTSCLPEPGLLQAVVTVVVIPSRASGLLQHACEEIPGDFSPVVLDKRQNRRNELLDHVGAETKFGERTDQTRETTELFGITTD